MDEPTEPIERPIVGPASPPPTGRASLPSIARYQIQSELGRGGVGVVYRAFDPGLARPVAIKMLAVGPAQGWSHDREAIARFVREARITARLRHPNIVAVHEVGDHEGQPFIVMDLVEGETLERLLTRQRVPHERLAALVAKVARALHHAHEQGVLHRDVKPSNVILDADGEPRLTDFGMARDTADALSHFTATGDILGTPAYMAPEQAAGQIRRIGPRTDVWAIGAVLYRALAGRTPHEAASPLAVIQNVLTRRPAPVGEHAPATPRDLETITMCALEREPRDRYASAADLADDLERFARGEPVLVRPRGRVGRAVGWARAHPVPLTTSVIAVAALLGLAAVLLGERRGEPPSPTRPPKRVEAPRPAPPTVEEQLAALRRLVIDDPAAAVEEATAFLAHHPRSVEGLMLRGRARYRLAGDGSFIPDLERAAEIEPDGPARIILGLPRRGGAGQAEQGIAECDALLADDPTLAIVHEHRAWLQAVRGDADEALRGREAVADLVPNAVWAQRRSAVIAHRCGELDIALDRYDRAVDLAPDEASNRIGRASVRKDRGEFEAALDDLDTAARIDPSEQATVFAERGAIRLAQGRLDDAIREATLALDRERSPRAFRVRAHARRAKGELTQAISDGTRALLLDRTDYISSASLGITVFLDGERSKAVELLRDAWKLKPGSLGVSIWLAMFAESPADRPPPPPEAAQSFEAALLRFALGILDEKALLALAAAEGGSAEVRDALMKARGLIGLRLDLGGDPEKAAFHYRACLLESRGKQSAFSDCARNRLRALGYDR